MGGGTSQPKIRLWFSISNKIVIKSFGLPFMPRRHLQLPYFLQNHIKPRGTLAPHTTATKCIAGRLPKKKGSSSFVRLLRSVVFT